MAWSRAVLFVAALVASLWFWAWALSFLKLTDEHGAVRLGQTTTDVYTLTGIPPDPRKVVYGVPVDSIRFELQSDEPLDGRPHFAYCYQTKGGGRSCRYHIHWSATSCSWLLDTNRKTDKFYASTHVVGCDGSGGPPAEAEWLVSTPDTDGHSRSFTTRTLVWAPASWTGWDWVKLLACALVLDPAILYVLYLFWVRVRAKALAKPQAAGLRFGGLEDSRWLAELHGVFAVDPEQPVANGRPHYRTAAGGHLYYVGGRVDACPECPSGRVDECCLCPCCSVNGKWVLNIEFTPDNNAAAAFFATAGAVPVGAAVWRYGRGQPGFVDRELTVAELTAAEVAAAEQALATPQAAGLRFAGLEDGRLP